MRNRSGSTSDAEMKKKKGNRAMGKKKYPKAVKYYTKAIRADPKNSTYHLNRAIAHAALELWKDAEVDAGSAVRLGNPPSTKSHYQLARAKLRRGMLDDASDALEQGLQEKPGEPALLELQKEIGRAIARREQRRLREEQEAASRAPAAQGPGSARALLDQARGRYEAGDLSGALELLQAAREAAEADGAGDTSRELMSVLSLLGKACMKSRDWKGAATAFRGVAELEEKLFSLDKREEREALATAYNNLGICLKNAGQMSEAIDALNNAYMRATNGDDKMATMQAMQVVQNLAQCLRVQRKMREAEQMFARALEIGNRLCGEDHCASALNHLGLARCLREQGKIKEAIMSYTKALEIWVSKDAKTCLQELPEVPSEDRVAQLQEQTRAELGQLLAMVEQAQRGSASGEGPLAQPAVAAA
ncbi:unnamed protein product [Prorocentrum cordatum]|uniref:UDP-N-acetylglucosamine--peptide N-acetylglucosaminyltransferase SPINDLY n=1 Tax=Prorocentrum cordatum TaxID=2364126 RepID=A0ABN9RDA8_9DINO|nr:unnamed protein product [Polarella glacialis]